MSKRVTTIQSLRNGILDDVAYYLNGKKAIQEHQDYSDSFKKRKLDEWDATHGDNAKRGAREAWTKAQRLRQEIEAEIPHARERAEDGLDWSRVGIQAQEMRARLARPENVISGDTVARRVQRLREDALRRGDRHALRALRIASTEALAQSTPESPDHQLVSDLARSLQSDEDREYAELVALEAEWQDVQRETAELRYEILQAETHVEPSANSYGVFGVSGWQSEILGERNEDFGGGVVWKNGDGEA